MKSTIATAIVVALAGCHTVETKKHRDTSPDEIAGLKISKVYVISFTADDENKFYTDPQEILEKGVVKKGYVTPPKEKMPWFEIGSDARKGLQKQPLEKAREYASKIAAGEAVLVVRTRFKSKTEFYTTTSTTQREVARVEDRSGRVVGRVTEPETTEETHAVTDRDFGAHAWLVAQNGKVLYERECDDPSGKGWESVVAALLDGIPDRTDARISGAGGLFESSEVGFRWVMPKGWKSSEQKAVVTPGYVIESPAAVFFESPRGARYGILVQRFDHVLKGRMFEAKGTGIHGLSTNSTVHRICLWMSGGKKPAQIKFDEGEGKVTYQIVEGDGFIQPPERVEIAGRKGWKLALHSVEPDEPGKNPVRKLLPPVVPSASIDRMFPGDHSWVVLEVKPEPNVEASLVISCFAPPGELDDIQKEFNGILSTLEITWNPKE